MMDFTKKVLIHELPSYTGTAYVSKNVNPIKWDSFVSLL